MLARIRSAKLMLISFVLSGFLANASVAKAGNTGVLCLWTIYLSIDRLGDRCFSGQQAEIRSELNLTIQKFDVFIMANTPIDRAALEAAKKSILLQSELKFNSASAEEKSRICLTETFAEIYRDSEFRAKFIASIKQNDIDEFLAKPRKPTMDTCI